MNEFTGAQQDKETSPMWQYLEHEEYNYQAPSPGDIREGIVLKKTNHEILVDLGLKREAVVPYRDIQKLTPEEFEALAEGEPVRVFILPTEDDEGRRLVSINLARVREDWKRAEAMHANGEIFEGEVIDANKGGVIVAFGRLRGFVPASQLVRLPPQQEGQSHQERLKGLVGRRLPLKVIEVDPRRRRLILSERAAHREQRAAQREKLLAELQPGDVRRGTVTNLQSFGAFVDLGGADGLIHVSELAWYRVKHPREVLHVGQEVEVYVLNVDREENRIALSLKRLQPDPWVQVADKYTRGDTIEVEITNVTSFGAFARVEEGVEGLIHISELSHEPIENPAHVVRRGQRVVAQIISIDPDRQRIGLSLKRVQGQDVSVEPEVEGKPAHVGEEAAAEHAEPPVSGQEPADGLSGPAPPDQADDNHAVTTGLNTEQ
ncbi:MAG: S1 RNA-binding domain-containing protein [Ardenticatenia bacterium]|nr:S1 RNA-binding domain-containing protein [Ardenticatenia bacterium]